MEDIQCDIDSNRQLKKQQLMEDPDFNGDMEQLEEELDNFEEGYELEG